MRVPTATARGPVEKSRSRYNQCGPIGRTSNRNWTRDLGPSTAYQLRHEQGFQGNARDLGVGLMGSRIVAAWKTAGADLGIEVTAPVRFELDDHTVEYPARIASFGSTGGTLIVPLGACTQLMRDAARSHGMFLSELSEIEYAVYDRVLFVETLNDWGYFGPATAMPEWVEGGD